MELTLAQKTKAVIEKYDFRIQKKYGQNFLVDESVIERSIRAADIGEDDCVLEIGPGLGTLTGYLARAAGRVVCVEVDKKLIPILEETLADYDNITIINDDILKTDIAALCERYNDGRPFKVIANLPYYITTPIIMSLLESDAPIESITVMVQKEVAERMQAKAGTKEYGALSLAVQYYAEARVAARVPQNCFIPRPNVDSAVICLGKYAVPPVTPRNPDRMFALIRAAFNQRRKTLVNALTNAGISGISKDSVTAALCAMELPETVRGEALSLKEFAELSDLLFT